MTNSEDLLTANDSISIYARERRKKDEEIKQLKIEVKELSKKYIELLERYFAREDELMDKKSKLKIIYRKTVK